MISTGVSLSSRLIVLSCVPAGINSPHFLSSVFHNWLVVGDASTARPDPCLSVSFLSSVSASRLKLVVFDFRENTFDSVFIMVILLFPCTLERVSFWLKQLTLFHDNAAAAENESLLVFYCFYIPPHQSKFSDFNE